MTPEAQRIAIAEACGWKADRYKGVVPTIQWFQPDGQPAYHWYVSDDVVASAYLPDYLNDLNAMHEAEASLSHERLLAFDRHLAELFPSAQHQHCIHATAAQRAEAFLKTLNLWRD